MIQMREYIKDIHSTVETAVAKSIIKGICKKLDIEGKIALVKSGKEYANKYWNTGDTKYTRTGKHPLVITCIHEEEYTPETLNRTRVINNNVKPVFKDESNGTSINVLHVGLRNVISIEIHSKSENLLDRVENTLRVLRLEHLDVFELNTLYRYYMTNTANALVKFLGEGKKLEDYVAANTDSRFTLISNIDGSKSEYGFKTNSLVQVVISSDIDTEKVTYDSGEGVYTYTLRVKYEYERPTFMDCYYDYSINGKNIPDELMPAERHYDVIKDLNLNVLENNTSVIRTLYGDDTNGYYIRIPEYDKHTDIAVREPYTPIFSVLINIDKDNPLPLFNLKELGDLKLDDKVISLLGDEYNYLTEYSRSIFRVITYCGTKQLPDDTLFVDKDLNVTLNKPLTCNGALRIIFVIINDSTHIYNKDLKRLIKAKAFNKTKELGLLNRTTDKQTIDYKLDIPEIGEVEYVHMYSDIVINYMKDNR